VRHHFVKCRLSVSRLCRQVAVTADPAGQELSNRRLVLDDQHQSHLASRSSWASLVSKTIQVLTKPDFVFGVLDFIERLFFEDVVLLAEFRRAAI
jgi:hypothetical protein